MTLRAFFRGRRPARRLPPDAVSLWRRPADAIARTRWQPAGDFEGVEEARDELRRGGGPLRPLDVVALAVHDEALGAAFPGDPAAAWTVREWWFVRDDGGGVPLPDVHAALNAALCAADVTEGLAYPRVRTDWGQAWWDATQAVTLFGLAEAAGVGPRETARAALAVAANVRRLVDRRETRPAAAYAAAVALLDGRGDVAALEAAVLACDGATMGADASTYAAAVMGEATRAPLGVEGAGCRVAKFAARAALEAAGFDRTVHARTEALRAGAVRAALPLAVVLLAATAPGRPDAP